jgi:hypothetical protein
MENGRVNGGALSPDIDQLNHSKQIHAGRQ